MSPARRALLVLAFLLPPLAAAVPVSGQVSERRVRDAVEDVARGLGQSISGGSPLAGPSATTGGFGHFTLGAAATVTLAEIEDPTRSEGTVDFPVPTAAAGAAIGLWDGADLAPGLGGFGAIDLLGRFGTVVAREEIAENEPLMSLGVRVGILREGAAAPAVSVAAYRSWVDDLRWDAGEDQPSITADVRTLSVRADISKRLLVVTPYAGVGFDRTSIDSEYVIPASASTGGEEIRGTFDTSSEHGKAYAGIQLGLLLFDAALEVGTYDGGAFGALGVRVSH